MENYTKIKEDFVKLVNDGNLFHAYVFFGNEKDKIFEFTKKLAQFFEFNDFEKDGFLSDFLLISPNENGNIGIDEARRGQEFLFRKPVISKYRVLAIESTELMSAEAQNCLLKTIEEPPKNGIIILIANSPESLLSTIISRSHKIYFPSVKRPQKSKENSDEFISKVENRLIDLSKDLSHNSKKVEIALDRLSKMKQFNLNQKLQSRFIDEYLK